MFCLRLKMDYQNYKTNTFKSIITNNVIVFISLFFLKVHSDFLTYVNDN